MKDKSIRQAEREMNDAMLQERRRRKRRKIIRILLAWLLALFIIVVVLGLVVVLVMASGGRNLRKQTQSSRPNLHMEEADTQESSDTVTEEQEQTAEPEVVWQEGWVRHNGKIYEYNDDIMTFLVLGIDKQGTVKESTSLTGGGQSDAIFLVIVNPDEKDTAVRNKFSYFIPLKVTSLTFCQLSTILKYFQLLYTFNEAGSPISESCG